MTAAPQINRADVVAQVRAAFDAYEAALVANDLPALAAFFWDHPAVFRLGPGQTLVGPAQIATFRAARPADDLARVLTWVQVTTHGTDFATVAAEYRRLASGRTGRQSQTWARIGAEWRIVAAHVSLDPV